MCVCGGGGGGGTSDFFNYKWEAKVITAKVCEEEY